MDSQNGVFALESIVCDVAVPAISKIEPETLGSLIFNFFLFRVFDAEEGEVPSEDPLHFFVLESFFFGPSEVFDVVVEVFVVGSDELDVLALLT